jgi:hypothetical protein
MKRFLSLLILFALTSCQPVQQQSLASSTITTIPPLATETPAKPSPPPTVLSLQGPTSQPTNIPAPTHLYLTKNGGINWIPISSDCPLPLGSEMQFIDPQTGFAFHPISEFEFYRNFDQRVKAARNESVLYSTQDGGVTWSKVALQLSR